MNKLTVVIGTLLLIVITGALLAAACGGGDAPVTGGPEVLDPKPEDNRPLDETCDVHKAACREFVRDARRALQRTPPSLDPQAEQILMQDPAIEAMVGTRILKENYWLLLLPTADPAHGDDPGMVATATIVFAQPVSWEGLVNTASQPCKGQGNEGYIDPDHPPDRPRGAESGRLPMIRLRT